MSGEPAPDPKAAKPRRRWRERPLLLLALGLLAGAAGVFAVLYQKPGRNVINRIRVILKLRQDNMDRFGFGMMSPYEEADWQGVISPTHPEWKVRRGVDVVKVAGGFTYPVNIVFAPPAPGDPDAPYFYVNELHGAIKYVTARGSVHTYAEGLVNFEPIVQPKSDETGVSGLLLVPGTHDLIATIAYLDAASGLLSNKIVRLVSGPGGRKMKEVRTLLDLGEFTSPSNQIQQAVLGSDGKLYVSVGDGENPPSSLDLGKFAGKILRMELDGAACADNPFFDPPAPRSARSYVYAYGIRNAFDLDLDPVSGALFAVDNGKANDRLMRIAPGASYGWNGLSEGTLPNAMYVWKPTVSPCGVSFLREGVLGPGTRDRLYVALYGPPFIAGKNHAKKIVEFEFDERNRLIKRVPATILQYVGTQYATVLGLAEGPDGLYFTDFFGSTSTDKAAGAGGVWKVVPSKKTLDLPEVSDTELARLKPAERGKVHFSRTCSPCHSVEGVGGREGPDLTHFRKDALLRLGSRGYEEGVRKLMASDQTFAVEQRPRLKAVLDAGGEGRVRTWLTNHIEEPRFDNPRGRMPTFTTLPQATRGDIIEFLMSR